VLNGYVLFPCVDTAQNRHGTMQRTDSLFLNSTHHNTETFPGLELKKQKSLPATSLALTNTSSFRQLLTVVQVNSAVLTPTRQEVMKRTE
jgi:hypothetical protein